MRRSHRLRIVTIASPPATEGFQDSLGFLRLIDKRSRHDALQSARTRFSSTMPWFDYREQS
jgi:hypothetical protein